MITNKQKRKIKKKLSKTPKIKHNLRYNLFNQNNLNKHKYFYNNGINNKLITKI